MEKLRKIRFLFFILIFNFLSMYYIKIFYKNSHLLKSIQIPKFSLPNNILITIFYIFNLIIVFCICWNYIKGNRDLIYFLFIILEVLWGYLFFIENLYGISFLLLMILIILCTYMGIKFLKVLKLSSIIMFLYSLWLIYFCILNFFIWVYNEM